MGAGSIDRPGRWGHGVGSLAMVAVAALLASCAAPDRPDRLPRDLPNGIMEWLRPDSARRIHVTEGVVYHYLWSPSGPWAVHVASVDLGRCELGIGVASAREVDAVGPSRAPVSLLHRLAGPGAIAAVNGDFFTPEGLPLGPEVIDGIIRRRAAGPCLAWRPGMDPWIGRASAPTPGELRLEWTLADSSPDGLTQVIGGFPELLEAGMPVGDLEVEARPSFAAARHPRTAVAYDASDEALWLVVVDGRQEGYSAGMSLPELTDLIRALGADEALNLDGGASSVMVLRGRVVSSPSDAEGERSVSNALVILRDPAHCLASR